MEPNVLDFVYLGLCLEAFFFGMISVNCQVQVAKAVQYCPIPGLYSGIFAIYLQHHESQKSTANKAKNILFYALWVLYALCAATGIIDILMYIQWPNTVSMDDHGCLTFFQLVVQDIEERYQLSIIQNTVFACGDFIAQFILVRTTTGNIYHLFYSCFIHLILQKIYRCWIMWGYSIRVVILPSFLAFAFLGPFIYLHSLTDFNLWFLAMWIASGTPWFDDSAWIDILTLTSLTLSMAVNALMTGLIVFSIFKVFQKVKTSTADDKILGVTGGSKLRRIIFILIESGMALFSIQLVRLVVSIVTTDAAYDAFNLIVGIHEMLNVIIRSVIVTLFYW